MLGQLPVMDIVRKMYTQMLYFIMKHIVLLDGLQS
jgi:hypothetical protein